MNALFIEKHPQGIYQVRTLLKGKSYTFNNDPSLDLRTAYEYCLMIQENLLKEGVELPSENIVLSLEALRLNSKKDAASFRAFKNMKLGGYYSGKTQNEIQ